MRVCFLQNVLFEYRIPFYNGLVKRGFDVTVVHSGKEFTKPCLFQQIVTPMRKLGAFYWQPQRPDLQQYDAVVAMFDLHWPANIMPVFSRHRPRWVFWGHGLGRNGLGNRLRIVCANRADAMVLYTEVGRQAMLAAGLDENLSYVANNTVEVENHAAKAAPGNSFLYVGRLQARKRVDLVMQAFANVLAEPALGHLTLDIVGDGDIRPQLEQLAEEVGIKSQVRFHGAITDNALLKPLFHNALAYVSPGHLGLGLNHAMAFGVPVLSNAAVTHAPEVAVLNESNSVMIDAQDDEQVVEQLRDQLRRFATDSDWAMTLSKSSYKDYVDYCSMERMIDGFEAAIRGKTPRA